MKNWMLFSASLFIGGIINAQNPLVIPDTLTGTVFDLHVKDSTKIFYTSFATQTMGVNADYLGPTLIFNQGDSVVINVYNELMDTTTIHWHGLHVNAVNDGGPHTTIPPMEIWSPAFKVRDQAATYWYHPHLHMMTNKHATMGAAGMIIVRDAVESALVLPRKYGIDDFPVVIQSKCFDSNKQIVIDNHSDSVTMINGTLDPYLNAPAQVIRLRLLNASSERVYRIGWNNNMSFYQISTDGGLLDVPVALTRMQLAPGERAEILIDLGSYAGQTLFMMNYGSELPSGIYGSLQPGMGPGLTANLIGYSANVLNGSDYNLLQINVGTQTANAVTTIPSALITNTPYPVASANANKTLTFTSANNIVGPFVINGTAFDMNVINQTIPLNNIEIWTLSNQSPIAHPFHIHDVQFYITDMNGNLPPANLKGRKDVVLVMPMQTVTFITKFETFCDEMTPYVYHCHMLPHEDDGMMGQFLVTCPSAGVDEFFNENTVVFPNPSSGIFHLHHTGSDPCEIRVTDVAGKVVFYSENELVQEIDLSSFSSGLYEIRIITEKETQVLKVVKE